MSTIGVRLKEVRESTGKSQEAFGALGGVGKRAQINYEQDLRVPDADYLARIAAGQCDVLYILTGERSNASRATDLAAPNHSRRAVSAAETALGDRARLRAAVAAVAEGLAETRRKLPPAKHAELILAAYDLMAEPQQTRDNVIRLVRSAAA